MKKACSSIANETSELDLTNLSSVDLSQFIKSRSPCKDKSCAKYFKEVLAKLPYMGINAKALGDTTLKLCVDMANGKLAVDEALKEMESLLSNVTIPGLGSVDGSVSGDMIDQLLGNLTDDRSSAVTPSKTSSPTTTPAPTKSSAGALSTVAAAFAVSATLAAFSS